MKLKKYSHYKDSHIDWIGDIPENWELKKMNGNIKFDIGFTPSTGNDLFYDGNEVWVTIGDMKKESIKDSKSYLSDLGVKGHKKVKKGSLLYSFKLSVGKVAFAGKDLYTNEAIASFSPSDKYDLKYLYYHFPDSLVNFGTENIYGAKILNQELIKSSKILLPPLKTQKRISSFLDSKTNKLENLIEKDKKLIELLKERRVSLINKAVTKGIDDSVKMKDSGIEWIGEIPESWEARRINKLSYVRRGASPRPIDDPIYFDEDGEYSWVRISDVTASDRYLFETEEKLSSYGKAFSVPIKPGEIFISIAGSVGKAIISKIKCCIHDGFVYFQNLKVSPEYLYYIFLTGEPYKGLGKQGTQLNLNTETIGNISIPFPNGDIQREIVEFLDKETSKIDNHIKKVEKRIELYEEYKKSLIYNVVTGKVEV